MKKTILILFLVAVLLLLGCDASGENEMTTTPSPFEQTPPAEVKYHAYTAYMISVGDDVKACYSRYQYLPWMRVDTTYAEQQAMALTEPFYVEINGENKLATPGRVQAHINNLLYQKFNLEGEKWVTVDLVQQKVCKIVLKDKEIPPQSAKLTQDQCRNIALGEIFQRLSWSFRFSSYREEVKTRVTEYGETVYQFYFTKYIDGMETDSQIIIAVGESGRISGIDLYWFAGEIKEARYRSLNPDIERAKAAMDEHVRQLVDADVPFEVYDWAISQWNGYYTLDCQLKVMNLNGTRYAYVAVKIPLEDIYE